MRATARFVAHIGAQSRFFEIGEEVPAEWAATIGNPHLVDEPLPHLVEAAEAAGEPAPGPDPFPGFSEARTVDDVIAWVNAPDDPTARYERAVHALEAERAFRARTTLMAALEQIIDTYQGGI
jgi:hypothetical protein